MSNMDGIAAIEPSRLVVDISADNDETIEHTLSRLDENKAEWVNDRFLVALADLYGNDRQKYKSIYYRLKKWGIASDVDKEVRKLFSKYRNNLKNTTYPTLPTLSRVADGVIQHQSNINPTLTINSLVIEDEETGKDALIIESSAALLIADAFSGFWAWSNDARTWHRFVGTHWQAQPADGIDRDLIDLLYKGTGHLGFKPCYKNGIKALIAEGQFLPLNKNRSDLLPFINGLLNLKNTTLIPTTKDNALTWCLPYRYKSDSDCPRIKKWLLNAVDGDKETVDLLRAWMAAVLHGRADLQKFLHLIGMAGTGKGVFMRMLTALVGEQNTATTDLKVMEQNQFEAAKFYNKRLITITDTDRYGGSLNKLKALTGQDYIPLERKHQQQEGGFIFGGIVVMASNEFLTSTDHTSGIDRRRSMVRFDRQATDTEKQEWARLGGEEAVIHSELPGLVNWLLELSQDDISRIIRNPPERSKLTNDEAKRAINPIYAWVCDCCEGDVNTWTQVGVKKEIREIGKETVFENSDIWLYANYLTWCQRNGHKATSSRKFTEDLMQTLRSSGWKVSDRRIPIGNGIDGIKLKQTAEPGESDVITL